MVRNTSQRGHAQLTTAHRTIQIAEFSNRAVDEIRPAEPIFNSGKASLDCARIDFSLDR